MTVFYRIRQWLTFCTLALTLPLSAMAEPLIAAAANVQSTLEEIVSVYEVKTGQAVRVSYGSTSSLMRQIQAGAPFDLFLAADNTSIKRLVADGLTQGPGRDYATGRLALVAPKGGVFVPDADFAGFADALVAGQVKRFAIASPAHAPYGIHAVEALRHAGHWEQTESRLVLGENVAQAAQFVASGNADGGLIALSLALSPAVAARVDHAVVPADWHAPLVQSMVLLPRAGNEARAFFDFLLGPEAREIFAARGYDLPVGG